MSKAMRNFVQPHKVVRPCRMGCGTDVPALVNGTIVQNPICPSCRAGLDREFRIASIQRSRQTKSLLQAA